MNIRNRKALYEFHILNEYEAGIILTGNEVKSIRNGLVTLNGSYIYVNNNEVFIKNLVISKYNRMHPIGIHEEDRDKKLLLTKKQIRDISKALQDKGTTCIPISIIQINNKIKVKIGVAKGKKLHDKRNKIKERDLSRESE